VVFRNFAWNSLPHVTNTPASILHVKITERFGANKFNVSSMNIEKWQLVVNSPLTCYARLLGEEAICSKCSQQKKKKKMLVEFKVSFSRITRR
jgi:hypothetical protein